MLPKYYEMLSSRLAGANVRAVAPIRQTFFKVFLFFFKIHFKNE